MDSHSVPLPEVASMLYAPRWEVSSVFEFDHRRKAEDCLILVPSAQPEILEKVGRFIPGSDPQALTADETEELSRRIRSLGIGHVVFISVTPWRLGVDEDAILAVLKMIKALSNVPNIRLDFITVNAIASPATSSVTHPIDGIFIGFGQTVAREFEGWDVRCFSLAALTPEHLNAALKAKLAGPAGSPIVIDGDRWWSRVLAPACLATDVNARGFKRGGKYLVIGARGGIGGALSEYLAGRYQARLVLAGRSPHGDGLVQRLEALGGNARYEQLDLADPPGMKALLDRHPDLDGIVHSALVLDDASIINMRESSMLEVLRPKVQGTINLAKALEGRRLDFVLLFSSIQSYLANPGQANYAAASVCEDAIGALLRDALMVEMKILNWGYWGSIGAVATQTYRERMRRLEIGSIEAEEGIAIIEQLLMSKSSQVAVIKASPTALRRLGIEPHLDTKPARPDKLAGAVGPLDGSGGPTLRLSELVPAFDAEGGAVARNIAGMKALQSHARFRLSTTLLPSHADVRHAQLLGALNVIPASDGPTRDQLLKAFPEWTGHVDLLDACIENLPSILSGKRDPLSVLFPDGSFDLVDPIYGGNPSADYFNQQIAEVVDRFAGLVHGRTLRILEIGAGTGSTAKFVLPKLQGRDASYVFTDLSHAFLIRARKRFAAFPFVSYGLLDIERPTPNEEPYDVVLATNVIHATSDLLAVLQNVHQRIRPGGLFILNEITSLQDYATLTFGLTEGWWKSTDRRRIPNSPLVSGEGWRSLLLEAGFGETCLHGSADQQMIVARVGPAAGQNLEQVPSVSNAEAVDGRKLVESYVASVIAEVLQADESEIAASQPFHSLGIDSLIALELLKPFRVDLGYLPTTLLFEHPTVASLAAHLLAQYGEKVCEAARLRLNQPTSDLPPTIEPITEERPSEAVTPDGECRAMDLCSWLREIVAETMLYDPSDIDDEATFASLGIDSIIALELLKPLRTKFGYLPATLLFEHPSIRQLAKHLDSHQAVSVQGTPATEPGVVDGFGPWGRTEEHDRDEPREPELHPLRLDDIAIVGIAGRFPCAGAASVFWQNLLAGRECTSEIQDARWPKIIGQTGTEDGPVSYATKAAFIQDVDAFDSSFFNITPLDAERMDPQERIFLEVVHHAMEDGGLVPSRMRGTGTGVFVGVMNGAYAWHRPKQVEDPPPTSMFWSIANRVSYLFDLKGPSLAVDTACSSSMTALHLACQALRSGDCETALVGGVNLIVHPRQIESLCDLHMLSRTDLCRPFGVGADGFVDGEGVCCIVAKRYEDAVRDADRIYGVVRGTAINAGGLSNGYSAPNPEAQAKVITHAIKRSGLQPLDIALVEAHGTGTVLGDAVEIRGLTSAFEGVPSGSIVLGSVKGNIGHLESAAGLAGMIKVLLQLHHRTYVPSINAEEENPHLDLVHTPFRLQRQVQKVMGQGPLVACVSSFGAGGANAHAVVQSVQEPLTAAEAMEETHVAVISSKTAAGLQRQIDALHDWLERNDAKPAEIAYTLCCAREFYAVRAGFVFQTLADLRAQLREARVPCSPRATEEKPFIGTFPQTGRLSHKGAQCLVDAFVAQQSVDFLPFHPRRRVISLPGYAFTKRRFWVDSTESSMKDANALLRQHRILGLDVAPAAWSLSTLVHKTGTSGLNNVMWPCAIHDLRQVEVQTREGRCFLRSLDGTLTFCEGTLEKTDPQGEATVSLDPPSDLRLFHRQEVYERFSRQGYDYGPDLQVIRWVRGGTSYVEAVLDVEESWGFRLSPALLDGGMQTALLLPGFRDNGEDEIFVPFLLGGMHIWRIPRAEPVYCSCIVTNRKEVERSVTCDIRFADVNGKPLILLKGVTSLVAKRASLRSGGTVGIPQESMAVPSQSRVQIHDFY